MSNNAQVGNKARGLNSARSLPTLDPNATLASYFFRDFSTEGFPESAISNVNALARLSINGCKLGVIPEHIFNHTALISLNFQDNDIRVIPDNITKLTSLTELILGENKLGCLPTVLLSLPLKRLSLAKNNIVSLPEDVTGSEPLFQSLEQLDLSHNEFRALPFKFLSHFKVLGKLDMQFNPLGGSVAPTTTATTTTTTATVAAAAAASTAEITTTTTTTTTEASSEGEKNVAPSEEKKEDNAQKENAVITEEKKDDGAEKKEDAVVTEEKKEEISDEKKEDSIASPDTVATEGITEEKKGTPEDSCEKKDTAVAEEKKEDDKEGKEKPTEEKKDQPIVESSPSSAVSVSGDVEEQVLPGSLTELILSNCHLKAVPHSVYGCKSIKKLVLSNNDITHFEDPVSDLAMMSSLEVLEMNVNKLITLPDEICAVTTLTELCADDNCIEKLPDNFGSLTQLQIFGFMGNRLKTLPPSFSQLGALKNIDMMFNRMETFPSVLSSLPQRISYLALSGNAFDSIPPEVEAKCDKTSVADLDPPVEIVKDILYLGSYRSSKSYFQLKRNNIKQVLIIAHNISPPYPGEFDYKVVIADDTADTDLIPLFPECNQYVDDGAAKGCATLIHCAAGISRSATLCMAYLIAKKNMSAKEAMEFVRERRPIVCPNEGFRSQLVKYEQQLRPSAQTQSETESQSQRPRQSEKSRKCTLL